MEEVEQRREQPPRRYASRDGGGRPRREQAVESRIGSSGREQRREHDSMDGGGRAASGTATEEVRLQGWRR
jgi:hypothetical protein